MPWLEQFELLLSFFLETQLQPLTSLLLHLELFLLKTREVLTCTAGLMVQPYRYFVKK